MPDQARVDELIELALLCAGAESGPFDRDLGEIHLIKYVYLVDLEWAARHAGQTYTGIDWTFYRFGPWNLQLQQRIAPLVRHLGGEVQLIEGAERDFSRYSLRDEGRFEHLDRKLPHQVVSTMKKYVRHFGKDTGNLLNHVYLSRPMRNAAPGERIDFSLVAAPHAAEPAVEAPASRTAKQEKKFEQAKKEIRGRLDAARERAPRREFVEVRPPYDDTFEEGVRWLDSDNGEPIAAEGELEFSDDIWKSSFRAGPSD